MNSEISLNYRYLKSLQALQDRALGQETLTVEEQLDIALLQLDRAHQEIQRLLRVAKTDPEVLTSPLAGTGPIDSSVSTKEYDTGYVWAKALNSRHHSNPRFLRSYRALQTKRGQLSELLDLTNALAAMDKSVDPKSLRQLEGRVREVSGWVPVIPGERTPVRNPRKNRVLHLVKESRPYLSNGFTSRSHRNFLAEAQVGLDPIVITEPGFPARQEGKKSPSYQMVDGIQHVRLDAGDIDYDSLPVDRFLQMFASMAYRELMRLQPAVLHASSGRRGYDTALVAVALQRKTGLPFVYEVRSFFEANWTGDVEWETKGELFKRRMLVEEMCMHAADKILTIGEAMREEIIGRGIPAEKIDIVPNAVDLSQFKACGRRPDLDRKYSLTGVKTFGYVSNMDHYRESQETLIEALAIMRSQGHNYKCVLVGSGPRRQELEKLAAKLNVKDEVVFTGSIDHKDISAYYELIDYFVVPRIRERAATYVTPLKPFEAMALKRPLIVSDLPALMEIADPPRRGRSFSCGNAADLAQTLLKAEFDPDGTKARVEQAHKWVASERAWEMNGARYASIFAKLTDGAE